MSPTFQIEQRPSPNHGPRAAGKPVDILLLHYTGMPSGERALAWLCDKASGVSSHYFVFEDGRVVRMVDEDRRAWHAGNSYWAGETDINSRSIGVEIDNPGHEYGYRAFPDAQIEAVIGLAAGILGRHPIPPERVLGHSDVAPARKEDPGELFPWQRLHDARIGLWVPPSQAVAGRHFRPGDRGEAVANLRDRFRKYGYGLGESPEYDDELKTVVRAFQRHFRPRLIDGIADVATVATLDRLVAAMSRRA